LLARDDNEQTFLHVVAKRNNPEEFEKVWEWVTKKLSRKEIRKILLAKDDHEQTVIDMAENKQKTETFDELWVWATEHLTPEEVTIAFRLKRK
jgi:endo-1,4-beta-D-glucanase Y